MAYKDLFVNLLKMSFVGVLTLIVCYFSAKCVSNLAIIIRMILITAEMTAVYLGLSYIFKVNYIGEILSRILSKVKKV